ncbi:MAG TPA: hypothetical protein DCS33_09210, partial [Gammaproteobacteria bacterium]|nr:hypothetical protein [Gammaproteobacteria bacterium]
MFRQLSVIPSSLLLTLALALWSLPMSSSAQEQALRDRWVEVRTANFQVFSQRSMRQTDRFATELEIWRQAAAFTISGGDFPQANVPNLIFLFDDEATLQAFAATNDSAFFASTPRANYLALAFDEESSISSGFHHYVHF